MFQAELKQSVSRLQGIGPKTAAVLAAGGITTINDLTKHYPRAYDNRLDRTPIAAAAGSAEGVRINCSAVVVAHDHFGWGQKQTLKIIIRDEDDVSAAMVCFGRNFLAEKLPVGRRIMINGIFQSRYNEIQSSSFEFEIIPDEIEEEFPHPSACRDWSSAFGRILPVYPLISGLSQSIFRKASAHAIREWVRNTEEELPRSVIEKYGLMSRTDAIEGLHFPSEPEQPRRAAYRLKFEELFHFQYAALSRNAARRAAAAEAAGTSENDGLSAEGSASVGGLENELRKSLGFELTESQQKVLTEIRSDIRSAVPMSRLLQGDVGSGKTLVAFISALTAIENGSQAAFMAPTELLARQHAENAHRLLAPLGLKIALLTGGVKADKRRLLLKALTAGEIDLVIGTHALFGGDVEFRKLGLIIIDEQQRFGVNQRLALSEKDELADMLMMTATPIPRTLAMTVFGDMEVSTIDERPPGRKPIDTHLAAIGNEQKVYDFIRRELQKGRQAYFVYPLISRTDRSSLKDAESMFDKLNNEIFPEYRLSLIHSRLDENEKKQIMDDFRDGGISILVATSVVEVGVDVPNASCMVIEHAERFGLSALHQLRGRVGRGEHSSFAFLVFNPELTEAGIARLKIMKETNDGFRIAEEDLKIRGPGNMSGYEQSGFIPFSIADLNTDFEILKEARKAAAELVEDDPGLLKAENAVYRRLMDTCPPFSDAAIGG